MCSRKMKKNAILIIMILSIGSLVKGSDVEISPLNSVAELDFSGNIVYAINFGDNGNPNVGGIAFSQDEEHPEITLDALGETLSTGWGPSKHR